MRNLWLSAIAPFLAFFFNTVLLLAYHVRAEPQESSLWTRLNPDHWNARDAILFVVLMLMSFELLDFLVKNSGKWMQSKMIPVRGKHLDDLTPKDLFFIGLSKAGTAPFVYVYLRYAFHEPNIVWDAKEVTFLNFPGALVALYIVYDFFYTILHWALHIKVIYGLVHKHHHHQKAPSRANVDAVNVHPVEFILGEYNHLLALFLVTQAMPTHIYAAVAFVVSGGVLAGLNHTRFDIQLSVFGITIFDSKLHDVHHRIPQSNYGQYTVFWDYIFGSYRPYDPNDRVNADAQLDPKTGKSLQYSKAQ